MITCGANGSIALWRTAGFQFVYQVRGHKGWVIQCKFSPDDLLIVSCSSNEIYLWRVSTGDYLSKVAAHSLTINSVSWSCDGLYFASASSDLTIRNLADFFGKKGCMMEMEDCAYQLPPQVKKGEVPCVSVDLLRKMDMEREGGGKQHFKQHIQSILRVVFHPTNPTWVLSGGKDCHIFLWDFKRRELVKEFSGHEDDVLDIKWIPSSSSTKRVSNTNRFVSCSQDSTIMVWKVSKSVPERVLRSGSSSPLSCFQFISFEEESKPFSHLISVSFEGVFNIWDMECEKIRYSFPLDTRHQLWVLSFLVLPSSPFPKLLTTSACFEEGILLWKGVTEREEAQREDGVVTLSDMAIRGVIEMAGCVSGMGRMVGEVLSERFGGVWGYVSYRTRFAASEAVHGLNERKREFQGWFKSNFGEKMGSSKRVIPLDEREFSDQDLEREWKEFEE